MKFNIDNVRICSDDFQVGDCTVTAIYENNEIGRFVFRVCPNYEGEPVVAIPCLIYVAEQFRKKGVGTKIIRSVPIHVKFMPDVGASGNSEEIHYSADGKMFMEHCLEMGIASEFAI